MAYEEYRLVLTHNYVDEDGKRTASEDPIQVTHVFPMDYCDRMILPTAVCINDMLDRMKDYILRKAGEYGGKNERSDRVF